MGGKRIKALKARVGCEYGISRRGQMGQIKQRRYPSGELLGGSHSVGRCGISKKKSGTQQGGQIQE